MLTKIYKITTFTHQNKYFIFIYIIKYSIILFVTNFYKNFYKHYQI